MRSGVKELVMVRKLDVEVIPVTKFNDMVEALCVVKPLSQCVQC